MLELVRSGSCLAEMFIAIGKLEPTTYITDDGAPYYNYENAVGHFRKVGDVNGHYSTNTEVNNGRVSYHTGENYYVFHNTLAIAILALYDVQALREQMDEDDLSEEDIKVIRLMREFAEECGVDLDEITDALFWPARMYAPNTTDYRRLLLEEKRLPRILECVKHIFTHLKA